MHHGDIEVLLQTLLDIEAFRSLDVFKVNTAKSRCDTLYCLTEFYGILLVDFDIEDIDSAVNLEEQTFAFHYGLTAHGTNITKSEHGGTIRDNGHQIAFVRIAVGIIRVGLNFQTRICHAWRVGQ